jgi:catechol 2,3-dioxygenase-like lactoylglutathione lyase family enzyme
MTAAGNVIHITPFMHAPDLEEALAFFEVVGFKLLYREANYAYLDLEGAGLRLLESRQDNGEPYAPHRGFAYYIDVRDVDAIVADLKPKLEDAGVEFMGPRNQPYRQREFMIRAPDGNVLVFGQAIAARP